MADIFVGYASADVERVRALVQLLSAQGWSVWWDHKIPIGKSFDVVIEGELADASCVVVVWSKASVESEWVKLEASEGKRRKILVPAVVDEVPIPFEFRRVETAKLQDWDFQSTAHAELHAFFSAIGGILQRPWSLEPEEAAAPARSEPVEPDLPESEAAVGVAVQPGWGFGPVDGFQRERAKQLLAHWFARNGIPVEVFREARNLVDRAPATAADERRMKLLDLCGRDDGALFTRAWRALDESPDRDSTPVLRFEAVLTRHLTDGDLDHSVYREAMDSLRHDPRDAREQRRRDVLSRLVENDDLDVSFFAYMWKAVEDDAGFEPRPPDVPEEPRPAPPDPPPPRAKGADAERRRGDGPGPPADEGGTAGAPGTTVGAAKPGSSVARANGGRKPDGGGTGGATRSGPRRAVISAIAPWDVTWLDVVSVVVALILISIFIVQLKKDPRDTSRGGEERPRVLANTVGVDTLGMDTIGAAVTTPPPVTPAVFLDSIRTQLALGRMQHGQAQYVAAASVLDRALGRLRSRALVLPDGDRRALEDSLMNLRRAVSSACADEEAKETRVDKGVPCPQ
ncbi:MAG TPA: toll/interleukin-1 receptor domain-containing protein [Longimicrobium sp.]|nr:toll/interleukin-1 receptor domain-containing protein [Longimicrobium sp.]